VSTAARGALAEARSIRGRNRGLELLRATEAAALSVGRWLGRGDKAGTREAGHAVMEEALTGMPFEGRIVIGPEGSNNRLVSGRNIGAGRDRVDLAVLPVDGISLVAGGLSQALSVACVAETGGILLPPPVAYMHKIAVGPQARGAIDISDTPENNLRRVAFAMNVQVQDLTVVLLDRPRHQALLERLRALGARVAIVSDGDVGLAMMAAWEGSGIDVMIGSGGTREAIVAACAMRCLGGELQCRPWVRHEDEAAAMREAGYDPDASLSMEQLVPGREVSVAVTGISGGGLLRGVRYHNWWAETHSLVMRAQSGTVREIIAKHHVALQQDEGSKVL
jgi:fructose-1,6-bisphosphatase II